MSADLEAVSHVLVDAASAIDAAHKAFGAPGDYGYSSKEGMALYALYQLFDPLIRAAQTVNAVLDAEGGPQ